jgi:hypothetical protein
LSGEPDGPSHWRFAKTCPEGAKHISPGQSEVALRHKRRPGKEERQNTKALKGRNNNINLGFCFALSGLESFEETQTQGVACG